MTHPLQAAFRARAATEPGYAMAQAYNNKMRVTADLCNAQGISFIPVVAESTGGWHKIAMEQLKKLGSALARHTGQQEGETIAHLITISTRAGSGGDGHGRKRSRLRALSALNQPPLRSFFTRNSSNSSRQKFFSLSSSGGQDILPRRVQ